MRESTRQNHTHTHWIVLCIQSVSSGCLDTRQLATSQCNPHGKMQAITHSLSPLRFLWLRYSFSRRDRALKKIYCFLISLYRDKVEMDFFSLALSRLQACFRIASFEFNRFQPLTFEDFAIHKMFLIRKTYCLITVFIAHKKSNASNT